MNRFVMAMWAAVLIAGTSGAEERGREPAAPGLPGVKERGRDVAAATPAERVANKQKMYEAEKARLDGEMGRLKDDPEMTMALSVCNTALAAMADNLKAQAGAAAAGDAEKLKGLEDQEKDLVNACWKARNGATLTRSAVENKRRAQNLPPARTPEAEAARSKFIEAMTKLADFYAEQAKTPPATPAGRGGAVMSPEMQQIESDLNLARDRARVEYDYQTDLANLKAQADTMAGQPEAKALADSMAEKITACHDTQLRLVEAQDAAQRAQTARSQAEQAIRQAFGAMKDRAREEAGRGRAERGRPEAGAQNPDARR